MHLNKNLSGLVNFLKRQRVPSLTVTLPLLVKALSEVKNSRILDGTRKRKHIRFK